MSEVYDLAVKLSLQDGISKIIGALGREVPILGKHFDKLKEGVNKTSVAIAGLGAAMAGIALFKGLEHLEKAGEGLVHAKVMLEAALPAQNRLTEAAKAFAAANNEAGNNIRSTIEGNVEALHDLYTVTQSIDHAATLLPAFNVLKNSYDSVKDQSSIGSTNNNADIANAIRAFELTGRTTVEAISKIAGDFTKTNIALRGRVTGEMLKTQIQTAGDSRYGFSDEFLTTVLPAMIATGLGNRTGSALNAFSNNLYGGVSSSAFQGKFQEKFGLHKQSDGLLDEKGHFKGFKVGSLWHADEARENPLKWANDYRKMLHDVMHVNVDNAKDMQDVVGQIGRGNKLLKADLDELLLPQTNRQLNKEVANIGRVGNDSMDVINQNDPRAWREALAFQMKNLEDVMGEGLVKPFIDNILKPMTLAFRDMSQWAAANPATVAAIGKGLLVLSAGLTALGTVLVGGALLAAIGTGGWIVVGLAALAAAIKLFKPTAFNEMAKGLTDFMSGVAHLDFGKALRGIVQVWKGELDALPGMLTSPIRAAISGIASIFTGALSGLGAGLSGAGGLGRGHAPESVPRLQQHSSLSPLPESVPRLQQHSSLSPINGGRRVASITVNHTTNLDGRRLAQNTTQHQIDMGHFPTAVGSLDSHGSYASPGTPFTDAA